MQKSRENILCLLCYPLSTHLTNQLLLAFHIHKAVFNSFHGPTTHLFICSLFIATACKTFLIVTLKLFASHQNTTKSRKTTNTTHSLTTSADFVLWLPFLSHIPLSLFLFFTSSTTVPYPAHHMVDWLVVSSFTFYFYFQAIQQHTVCKQFKLISEHSSKYYATKTKCIVKITEKEHEKYAINMISVPCLHIYRC